MKILATYNIKGGVGKTASAVNLAYLAASSGRRTLVWDLDPQGAASFYFRIEPQLDGGVKKLIKGKLELPALVRGTDYEGLDLLPADFSYRNLDLVLDAGKKPARALARLLLPLAEAYDLLILDCAPSISLVSEAIFVAADALLVPTIPTPLSLRTLEQLAAHLAARKRRRRVALLPFYCMVDRRKSLHRQVAEQRRAGEVPMLEAQIPYSTLVEQMGLKRAPVGAFAPWSTPAVAYAELWHEVVAHLAQGGG
jgi:cellulose biosynthesis protein BcsQ